MAVGHPTATAPDLLTDAAAPERRRFIAALGAINLVFLVLDLFGPARHRPLLIAARAVLSAALFGVAAWLGSPRPPPLARTVLRVLAVTVASTFAALAWAAGGAAGPYLYLLPVLSLIFTIAVPDDPPASLLCAATAAAAGLPMHHLPERGPAHVAFVLVAYGSIAAYATAAAWFHRSQRRREAALAGELRESERRRAEAERLALVGRLAAGVAHELNNPLSFAVANVTALGEAVAAGRAGPHDAEAAELVAETRLGLDRIRVIVDDLRAFARDRPEPAGSCDVTTAVDEALRLASLRLRVVAAVERELAAPLPPVRASRKRLVQVLVNLLVNAADALEAQPRGGARPARVRLEARAREGRVELAVEDSGPGLPEELRAHLFEPFRSTKGERGTGLGLALCREYVERLGGTIEAGTGELGGARFVVRLPAAGE